MNIATKAKASILAISLVLTTALAGCSSNSTTETPNSSSPTSPTSQESPINAQLAAYCAALKTALESSYLKQRSTRPSTESLSKTPSSLQVFLKKYPIKSHTPEEAQLWKQVGLLSGAYANSLIGSYDWTSATFFQDAKAQVAIGSLNSTCEPYGTVFPTS